MIEHHHHLASNAEALWAAACDDVSDRVVRRANAGTSLSDVPSRAR
jgi:hypothetical protein